MEISDIVKSGIGEIWVVCEGISRLSRNTLGLLSKARDLSNQAGKKMGVVLFAQPPVNSIWNLLTKYGVDSLYLFEDIAFSRIDEEIQSELLTRLVKKHNPEVLLLNATTQGRVIAARTASLLKTGLTADCTDLSIDSDGFLIQTRPAFGDRVLANIICPNSIPQMATVRPGSFVNSEIPMKHKIKLVLCPAEFSSSKIKILKTLFRGENTENLFDAEIVLAGGMGLGSQEAFLRLEKLARRLKVPVAATRAAVNEGFAPYDKQVGQSGQTIRPYLYIACGISGAVQHLAGIHGAKRIVAVNTDRHAPIFSHADYGVIMDCNEFIKRLEKSFFNE